MDWPNNLREYVITDVHVFAKMRARNELSVVHSHIPIASHSQLNKLVL